LAHLQSCNNHWLLDMTFHWFNHG